VVQKLSALNSPDSLTCGCDPPSSDPLLSNKSSRILVSIWYPKWSSSSSFRNQESKIHLSVRIRSMPENTGWRRGDRHLLIHDHVLRKKERMKCEMYQFCVQRKQFSTYLLLWIGNIFCKALSFMIHKIFENSAIQLCICCLVSVLCVGGYCACIFKSILIERKLGPRGPVNLQAMRENAFRRFLICYIFHWSIVAEQVLKWHDVIYF
jgi:hypothetical protein